MKKYKILCIDDSKSIHSFLKDCLTEQIETFTSVFNGAEAVEHLSDKKEFYDLIFLDWEMPLKNGPETFEELSKIGLKTPVFMLTSKNEPSDILRMISAGVTEYIMKPFTKDILIEKIQMHLD
ncbi:MAG: response regulator [Bacteriovoracaceae bacterium]